jgi:hypothetical protein
MMGMLTPPERACDRFGYQAALPALAARVCAARYEMAVLVTR